MISTAMNSVNPKIAAAAITENPVFYTLSMSSMDVHPLNQLIDM